MTTRKLSLSSRLAAHFRRWARRKLALRRQASSRVELNAMSDHELNDLGIGRSQIQARTALKGEGWPGR